MAIDLCNKREWQPAVGDLAAGFGNGTGADGQWAMPIEALGTHQREAVELARRTVLAQIDPRLVTGDPAAWSSDFGYELDRVAIRLDARPSAELHREALTNPDPAMREQALFEYADRNQPDAIELLVQAVAHDTDRQVRWAALWAIEKLGGAPAVQALQKFTRDPDPEIAEWAVLFRGELQTGDPAFDTRGSYYTPGRTFDETIPLLIHCDLYIRLDQTNQLWGKLSLAPQGLGRVYGHAHACPNVATRERQLVIAKAISGLHPDGSVHLDNYLFRGFTERTQADRGNFFFESHVSRPFFVSGRADDPSAGIQDTEIGFMRQGCWYLDHRFQVRDAPAIRYVRGRFQGWGYVNLSHVAGKPLDEVLLPGNAILSTLHDPVAGPLTNAFISGTFKGKLIDTNDDGLIDLNSGSVYSTAEGEVDSDMDGIPDEPGVACCSRRSPFPF